MPFLGRRASAATSSMAKTSILGATANAAPRRCFARSAIHRQTGPSSTTQKLKVNLPPRRPAPEQKWSNRTLVLMSTAVGSSMFMLGLNQGYNAGKRQALEEFQLGQIPEGSAQPSALAPSAA